MDLFTKKRAHFVGIGGVSTSSLSKLLLSYGWEVSGSDKNYSERLTELTDLGCRVWVGSDPQRIGLPDLAVYSGAVKKEDAEVAYCRCLGIPVYERGDFLNAVAENYRCVVGIAGTHGKTTATAMCAHLFFSAGKNFCAHIGGDSANFGNFCKTGEDWFITEACEYRKSMLALHPDLAVVLNAENDHPDTYKSLSEIYDAFDTYLESAKMRLVCGDTKYYAQRQRSSDAITYGFLPENLYSAREVKLLENGCYGFTICEYGNPICRISLNVLGKHNVLNALCSFVVGRLNGLDENVMQQALFTFSGVKRRLEKVGLFFGAHVICDYAHHPDEIKASLSAIRDAFGKESRIFAVFQPHTYSRTERLFFEFCTAFGDCDDLIIVKEYPARETPEDGKSAKELFFGIDKKEKRYFDYLLDVAAYLQKNVAPGDVIAVLGAGDVNLLCKILTSTD